MIPYRELDAWKESRHLCNMIYDAVTFFPKEELYALSSQMRRAAVSIPSNIAEGAGRGSIRDYIHFIYIARGSAYELETQIILCSDRKMVSRDRLAELFYQTKRVIQLLNGLRHSLENKERAGVREDIEPYGSREELVEPIESAEPIEPIEPAEPIEPKGKQL